MLSHSKYDLTVPLSVKFALTIRLEKVIKWIEIKDTEGNK
jgi:hypothetical protein